MIPIWGAEVLYLVLFSRFIAPINKEIMGRKARYLDERQLVIRDRAHYHAYQVLGMFLLSITMLPVAADVFGETRFPISFTLWHWQALYLLSINLYISLPASVLAWMEPDPRPDE